MFKWIIAILALLGIDQATKLYFASTLSEGDTIPIIEDFFHFTYTLNTGIVFGGMQGTSETYYWIFLIFAVIALGVFGYMFFKSDFNNKKLFIYRLALALLIAGTLGNSIDRIFQAQHAVHDFIDFRGIWDYIFNFADVFLNVGIFFFFFDTFFLEKKRVETSG
jgi:signal peptidase II